MRTFLIVVMLVAGVLFSGSVMLMSPKGGLGLGIGGASGAGGGEYGSTKSLETVLKRVALVSSIVFVLVSLFLPYTAEQTA